jgi:hypothetical protein
LALGSAALPALAGGHYVYIPQFYVIPGQKPTRDEVCVTPEVPVGAKQKSLNGDVMEILSLNGRSTMCRDKTKPILAHVLLTPPSDFTSNLKIALPKGFQELQVTDRNRFYGERFEAEDRKRGLHVWVKSWRRDAATNFNAWVQSERTRQMEGNGRTQSRTETVDLDGIEARRWDLIAEPPTGLFAKRRAWIETYIKGEHEFVRIEIGLNADDLEKYRAELSSIAENLQGLREPLPANEAPTEPAKPAPEADQR